MPRFLTPLVACIAAISACSGEGGPSRAGQDVWTQETLPVAQAMEPVDDDALAEEYLRVKSAVQTRAVQSDPARLKKAKDDLRRIANLARDPHLRANASLLLGSVLEATGDRKQAVSFYRHAAKIIDDDAGPHMALALALAAEGKHAEAATVQRRVVELDPDNLESFLALGEMLVKAGDEDGSTEAYAAYELRRKGLLDGLTLKQGGKYKVGPADRAACALALAAASDNGTALGLLYALGSEPEASVRVAIARTMGIQRLRGYREQLEKHLRDEKDAEVREVVGWAIGEIVRDPIDTKPARAPVGAGRPTGKPARP
jgi:tetratricopeptide (TPR) repeat protein